MSIIEPFNFTITSDTHSQSEVGENVENIFNNINSNGGAGDFLVVTGDLTELDTDDDTPDSLRVLVDNKFGSSFKMIPLMGNHDITEGDGRGRTWIKNEFTNANGSTNREAISAFAISAPTGNDKTSYYFFHKGIMFVVMNWYWNGGTNTWSDRWVIESNPTYTGGRIVNAQITWATNIFQTYPNYPKIVFGHSNLFPYGTRHTGTSYAGGVDPVNRDAFWQLLEDYNGIAYVHGHTHEPMINFPNNGKVAHICGGMGYPYSTASSEFSNHIAYTKVNVGTDAITFTIYKSLQSPIDFTVPALGSTTIPIPSLNEYEETPGGGLCYYSQSKPGTVWVDSVDNKKGWTVDFKLKVNDVQDTENPVSNIRNDGVGIYVNDGKREEVINFLTQEINFVNSRYSVIHDNTSNTDFRLVGKDNKIRLFASESGSSSFEKLAELEYGNEVITNGNSLKPSICCDLEGNRHSVWWDDGQGLGIIYYSKFSNSQWSDPEVVISDTSARNPSVLVNGDGVIYVVCEVVEQQGTAIGLMYKIDGLGWSKVYYTGNENGICSFPKIEFDNSSNVVAVWQDTRNISSDIYMDIFLVGEERWGGESRITSSLLGAYKPCISSYMDDIFIAWSEKSSEISSDIKILKYNTGAKNFSSAIILSNEGGGKADNPSILSTMSGKIFVVWQNDISGSYKLYACVLNPSMEKIEENIVLVNGYGGSRYPSLSENSTTGDIYIVWQDFNELYESYGAFNEYLDAYDQNDMPLDTFIYIAAYINGAFYSDAQGYNNVRLVFKDDRYARYPSTPSYFSGEMPIIYETDIRDEDTFVEERFFTQVREAKFDLSFSSDSFYVNYGNDGSGSPSSDLTDRDLMISRNLNTKEIRFGDFSDVLSVDYTFGYFKIYAGGDVDPNYINDITSNSPDVESLSALDASINNYGDAWIVGPCGIYYYIDRQSRIIKVEEGGEIPIASGAPVKEFNSIAFDKNGYMYISSSNSIYYSTYYADGFKLMGKNGGALDLTGSISCLAFDKNNKLYVGTSLGINVYTISENTFSGQDVDTDRGVAITLYANRISYSGDGTSKLPQTNVTCIEIDNNNYIWIGTQNEGIYRFYNGNVVNISTDSGLSSSRINGIGLRNTAIRYVATPLGIDKMVGLKVERNIRPDDGIWSSNVKSIKWKDPNILLAGTMDRINQIVVDDVDDTYSTTLYVPGNSSGYNNFQTYYIITSPEQSISDTDLIEVYINGNRIYYGYTLGKDSDDLTRIVHFDVPLNNDDIVEVIVRKDLREEANFNISDQERSTIGNTHSVVTNFAAFTSSGGTTLYAVVEGDENQIKINDSTSNLPFDKIHLDTNPPGFISTDDAEVGIEYDYQIDKSLVRLNIVGATDEKYDGEDLVDAGSGIESMIVSNYENFTTDGITEQEPVPFSSSVDHDLGLTLEDVISQITFSEGSGSCITYFSDVNELYAATSKPGKVYKYDFQLSSWEIILEYGADDYVGFIRKYNEQIIVGVGHQTEVGHVYIYDYLDGVVVFNKSLSVSESRVYCSYEFNGDLYIGTGIGDGDDSGYIDGAGDGGALYKYNDGFAEQVEPNLDVVVNNLDRDVYGIASYDGSSNLMLCTGPSGYIYEVDVEHETPFIVHSDTDALVSITSASYSGDRYMFVGGGTDGIIRRSISTNNSFNISFRSVTAKINSLKTFSIPKTTSSQTQTNRDVVYAAVGKVLYYLSDGGSWVWKYTHTDDILDFTYNSSNGSLYIISALNIIKISPLVANKKVYLKLIDRAGNESSIYTTLESGVTEINDNFYVSISISELIDFVNDNRIIEIDEEGEVLSKITGNSRFYSANKISQEKGVYISEIFNGTNDLVKWSLLTWDGTELVGTEILMYIRTSTSSNDILNADWIGPYPLSQSSGVDLSSFSGQYAQFKAELISERAGKSPTFKNATIQAVTTESIHFFTTNFVMPHRIIKGILTSTKVVPVAADVVFGINTTNSVEWSEYQEVDENRLFNVDQIGENLRVGIKLISPSRSSYLTSDMDEYGPYGTSAYINTIDFNFTNNTGETNDFHFKISLYEDFDMTQMVYSAYSYDSANGFNVDGEAIPEEGVTILPDGTVNVIFTVTGSSNIACGTYYFVKIEYIYDEDFEVFSSTNSFAATCSSSFVDVIDFNFENNTASTNDYHFRIRFYEDVERLNIYKTVFSGNNVSGWFVDDVQMSDSGATVDSGATANIVYRTVPTDFDSGKIYYLIIDVHDGSDFVYSYTSYTFKVNDLESEEYCGPYLDVPIVKNFGILFELNNNEFVTLNI